MSQQIVGGNATRALVALCLLAGCVLRLTALDVHSLWFDECGTLAVALADSPTQVLLADRHPPLSFWAMRGVSGWLGESDSMLRLLPALLFLWRAAALRALVALVAHAGRASFRDRHVRTFTLPDLDGAGSAHVSVRRVRSAACARWR